MLKYYYDLMSQPCRALYIFLRKNNLEFQKCPVALRKGEHKTAEFEKLNPFMLVPVIDDDGFLLTESIGIFRYLMNKYNGQIPDYWYPRDAKKQAKIDEYLEWQHLNTRFMLAMYFQNKWLIPLMTQSPPNEKKVAQFQERMEVVLDQFETIWLKEDKPYIAGGNLSLADLVAICEMIQPTLAGYDVLKDRPLLTAWFNRVKGELQPEFDEAHVPFNKLKKLTASKL